MQRFLKLCLLFSLPLLLSFAKARAQEWVIVANGPATNSPVQLREALKGKKVLALDGAADVLLEAGLLPDVILGDFDSLRSTEYWGIKATFNEIDLASEPYKGNFGVLIVPAKDQDLTDLAKGILFCDAQAASEILILHALNGRLDHTLGNLGLLRRFYAKNRPLWIETPEERIEYVRDGSTVIRGKVGDRCAIMAYPEAYMSTRGLEYNGHDYHLKLGFQESSCNKLAAPEAQIQIGAEALVIHPL